MYKHPISAFFRLLPALSWLATCAIVLWIFLGAYPYLHIDLRRIDVTQAWLRGLMLLAFVAVAIYAARMAYKEYKEYKEALPALRADRPIWPGIPSPRQPSPFTPTRYPLSHSLRAELSRLIETLQSAGLLVSGEVTIDEVIDCAETIDEWSEVDLYMAVNVLQVLYSERQRSFANIAFFRADLETDESDAVNVVRELVRLCGRSHELRAVQVRSIDGGKIVPAHRGFPPPNAVMEFELGSEQHTVPFVLYSKTVPGGLIEALAKILTSADDPRRFVWDNFDSFLSVCYLTPTQTSIINGAEQAKIPRFAEVR